MNQDQIIIAEAKEAVIKRLDRDVDRWFEGYITANELLIVTQSSVADFIMEIRGQSSSK